MSSPLTLSSAGQNAESWLTLESGKFQVLRNNSNGTAQSNDLASTSTSANGGGSRSGRNDVYKDGWSGEDALSSDFQGFQQASEQDTESQDTSSKPKFPSLCRDGPSDSVGSAQHGWGCKPCAFYCFSDSGCRDGKACLFCHLYHESRIRQRREAWKKSRKALNRDRIDGRRDRGHHDESDAARKAFHHDGERGKASSKQEPTIEEQPRVAYIREGSDAHWSQADEQATRLRSLRAGGDYVLREVYEAPRPSNGSDSHKDDITGRYASAIPGDGPGALPGDLANALSGAQLPDFVPGHAASVPANSFLGALPAPASRRRAYDELGFLMSMANGYGFTSADWTSANGAAMAGMASCHGMLQPGMHNGLSSSEQSPGMFLYSPAHMVVAVGQAVHMWPLCSSSRSRLFAVAPALPRGLTIDQTTGLIYGTAQEATDGDVGYFVTSCDASAQTTHLQVASIRINVISMAGSSSRYANLLQQPSVETASTLHDLDGLSQEQLKQKLSVGSGFDLDPDPQAAQVLAAEIQEMLLQTVTVLRATGKT